MKLTPGLYKLRSRSRFDPKSVYLVVTSNGKKIYYSINGCAGSPADDYNNIPLDSYELIKKLDRPDIDKIKVVIEWNDDYSIDEGSVN